MILHVYIISQLCEKIHKYLYIAGFTLTSSLLSFIRNQSPVINVTVCVQIILTTCPLYQWFLWGLTSTKSSMLVMLVVAIIHFNIRYHTSSFVHTCSVILTQKYAVLLNCYTLKMILVWVSNSVHAQLSYLLSTEDS